MGYKQWTERETNIKFFEEVVEKVQQAMDDGYIVMWDEELIPFITNNDEEITFGNVVMIDKSGTYEDMASFSLDDLKVRLNARLKVFKEIKLF